MSWCCSGVRVVGVLVVIGAVVGVVVIVCNVFGNVGVCVCCY